MTSGVSGCRGGVWGTQLRQRLARVARSIGCSAGCACWQGGQKCCRLAVRKELLLFVRQEQGVIWSCIMVDELGWSVGWPGCYVLLITGLRLRGRTMCGGLLSSLKQQVRGRVLLM